MVKLSAARVRVLRAIAASAVYGDYSVYDRRSITWREQNSNRFGNDRDVTKQVEALMAAGLVSKTALVLGDGYGRRRSIPDLTEAGRAALSPPDTATAEEEM